MDDKKYFLGNGLSITDKDRHYSKTINNENWEIKIPMPSEKMFISRRVAEVAGGFTKEQLGADAHDYIRIGVTIQTVLTITPEWWDGIDNCTNDDLIYDLWRFYLESEKNFDSRLKTLLKTKHSGQPKTSS